jgi:hypothetical protein
MDKDITLRITTAIIVIIILAILIYNVQEEQPSIITSIPKTNLTVSVHPVLNVIKNDNNWINVDTKHLPSISSQLFIDNMFMGNIVAYVRISDKTISLMMDRDVQINTPTTAYIITTTKL